MTACPCHSGLPYGRCCRPYHRGELPATAVALMRSRYSAYALGKVSYIMRTQYPDSPLYRADKKTWRQELNAFVAQTEFIGLQILDEQTVSNTEATVTFQAILQQRGQDASFIETSLFIKRQERWFYVRPLPARSA